MAITSLLERLLEQPWVYRLWQAPFVDQKFAPVQRHLDTHTVHRVLDVACGPGTNASRFPGSRYVGIDINEHYLNMARLKSNGEFIQADLSSTQLTFLGKFDTILVNSFLHHLPDEGVQRVLSQLASVLESDGRVHILELVLPERPGIAKLVAKLDRGRYARSQRCWQQQFERYFQAVVVEPYKVGGGLWQMLYFQGKAR